MTQRFFREEGIYKIETDGPAGMAVYPVAGVAGLAPLQQ